MKKILVLTLPLLSTSLQARKIIIVKTKSAAEINTLGYVPYYTTPSKKIIGSKYQQVYFSGKRIIRFDINNMCTNLATTLIDTTKSIVTGNVTFKHGKNSLRYKLSRKRNRLILTPIKK